MAWIKILPRTSDDPRLRAAIEEQSTLYPEEYGPARAGERRVPAAVAAESIVMSHSLIPEALRHAFATYGVLLDPKLPLTRRQHEMIATAVSAANRCFY